MRPVAFLSTATLLVATSMLAAPALAQGHAHTQSAAPADAATWAEGEVRRIDRDNKKITLRHGEIKNLNMPPMTMVFQVRDPVLLDQAAVGAKVRFQAVQEGGTYVVTGISSP